MAELLKIRLKEEDIIEEVIRLKNSPPLVPPRIIEFDLWDLYLVEVLAYNRHHSVTFMPEYTIDKFDDERFKKYIEQYW